MHPSSVDVQHQTAHWVLRVGTGKVPNLSKHLTPNINLQPGIKHKKKITSMANIIKKKCIGHQLAENNNVCTLRAKDGRTTRPVKTNTREGANDKKQAFTLFCIRALPSSRVLVTPIWSWKICRGLDPRPDSRVNSLCYCVACLPVISPLSRTS